MQTKQPKLKRYAVPFLNLPEKSFFKKKYKGKNGRGERLRKRKKAVDDTKEGRSLPLVDFSFCDKPKTELKEQGMLYRNSEDLTEDKKNAVLNLHKVETQSVDKGVQVKSGDLLNTFTAAIQKDGHLNSLTVCIRKLVYFSYYILNCIKNTNSKSKYFI